MTLEEFLTYKPAKDTVDIYFIRKAKEIIKKQAECIENIGFQDLRTSNDIHKQIDRARYCQHEVEEILK